MSLSAQTQTPRTLLVMAGGTGGHIFPGLAVAEQLRSEGWHIVWLGNPAGMEYQLVPSRGIPFEGIHFGGLRGKGLKTKLLLPWNLFKALLASIAILRRIKPSVVLGMGGYVSFPAGLASVMMGYPLVLHEQNSVAGLTNKILAKIASRSLCAFPDALPHAEWVGNPLRAGLMNLDNPENKYNNRSGPLHVLIVGGSLGALALNEVMPKAIALIPENERPIVVHQSGQKHLETLKNDYQLLKVQAQVVPFIDDMVGAYQQADVVICRSGAMTVAELAASGTASYLIPFPYAVDDHQTSNARYLEKSGAAVLMPQSQLTPQLMADWLKNITRDQLSLMAKKSLLCAKPKATIRVAQVCQELVGA